MAVKASSPNQHTQRQNRMESVRLKRREPFLAREFSDQPEGRAIVQGDEAQRLSSTRKPKTNIVWIWELFD